MYLFSVGGLVAGKLNVAAGSRKVGWAMRRLPENVLTKNYVTLPGIVTV